jgi:DNA-binding NarL/FixJ family response regulator
VVKSDAADEILDAIETVKTGGIYFSSSVQKTVMENYAHTLHRKKSSLFEMELELTKREKQIVRLVAEGKTSQDIAEELFVSPRTVDTHRANAMKKLEARNTVEMVNRARERDILN